MTVAKPKHVIVAQELLANFEAAKIETGATVWRHSVAFSDLIDSYSGDPLRDTEKRDVTLNDPALLIYTSGTTGLPKAAYVSHHRVMMWTHWFAGMMGARAG